MQKEKNPILFSVYGDRVELATTIQEQHLAGHTECLWKYKPSGQSWQKNPKQEKKKPQTRTLPTHNWEVKNC